MRLITRLVAAFKIYIDQYKIKHYMTCKQQYNSAEIGGSPCGVVNNDAVPEDTNPKKGQLLERTRISRKDN